MGQLVVQLVGRDRVENYEFMLTCVPDVQKHIDYGFPEPKDGSYESVSSLGLWGLDATKDEGYKKYHSDNLYLEVYQDHIRTDRYTLYGVKRSKNVLNKDFFTALGSILAGTRVLCTEKNNIAYDDVFGENKEPSAEQTFLIPNIFLPVCTSETGEFKFPDKVYKKKTKSAKRGNKSGAAADTQTKSHVKAPVYKATVVRTDLAITKILLGSSKTRYQLVLEEVDDDTEILQNLHKNATEMQNIRYDLSFFKDLVIPKRQTKTEKKALLETLLDWDAIQDNHPDRNYQWLDKRDYRVIQTEEELHEALDIINNTPGLVSFDTETTGLNFSVACKNGQGDKLAGMVFSVKEGQSFYFPVRHKAINNICNDANEYEVIRKYFKPILEERDILMHNGIFDMKVMFNYDIRVNVKEDTMVACKLSYNAENDKFPSSLKGMTRKLLHRDSYELEDLVEGGNWGAEFDFSDLPLDYVRRYACADTDNTLALNNYMHKHAFAKYHLDEVYYETEIPFSKVVAYSEYFGMKIDMAHANELGKELEEVIAENEKHIFEEAGHEFKIDSPQELGKVLFEEIGCPPQGRTNSGNYCVDKKVLKKLDGMSNPDGSKKYPIIHYLREYKDAKKLKSSFVDLLNPDPTKKQKKKKRDQITADGLITSSVQPFLNTGRLSVNAPNYQSFNDTVKRYIVPRPGCYMMDADYSSVEYRITASQSGQENLIEAFFDPDTDYHKLQASRMFRVPYELVTSDLRHQAKSFNFGIPYGMGDRALCEIIFGNVTDETLAETKKLYEMYFEGQDKVREFFEKGREEGWVNKCTRTAFGRYRYYSPTESRASIERKAGNHKIQGTAADIYKKAMARLYNKICENGWWGKVLISGFIHDECLLEISTDINPAIMMKTLREAMMLPLHKQLDRKTGKPLWCPLYTGMGCGANWDDAKHIEIPVQVQESICKEYGETGFPWWEEDKDPQKLYAYVEQAIYDYKRDRVLNYLDKEENAHKSLKAVENDLAHEVLAGIKKGHYTNGVVDFTQEADKDVLVNLEHFCKAFDRMDLYEKADIQPMPVVETKTKPVEDTSNFEKTKNWMVEFTHTLGAYCTEDKTKILLNFDNKVFTKTLQPKLRKEKREGDCEVWLVKENWKKPQKTCFYMNSVEYQNAQLLYSYTL